MKGNGTRWWGDGNKGAGNEAGETAEKNMDCILPGKGTNKRFCWGKKQHQIPLPTLFQAVYLVHGSVKTLPPRGNFHKI